MYIYNNIYSFLYLYLKLYIILIIFNGKELETGVPSSFWLWRLRSVYNFGFIIIVLRMFLLS